MSLYRRFHDRFGTAGVMLGTIALILALGGSAIAASGALTSKQKKEVKKIAKQFAGKPGANGAAGPAGAAGPQGPAGPQGSAGANGAAGATILSGSAAPGSGEGADGDFYLKTGASPEIFGPKSGGGWGSGTKLKGANGINGTNGHTILSGTGAPTSQGEEGDFYIDTTNMVIYGPKTGVWPGSGTSLVGPEGPEGNIKETLPVGTPLKGTWSTGSLMATAAAERNPASISFGIPAPPTVNLTTYFIKKEEVESPLVEFPGPPAVSYHNCEGGVASPVVGTVPVTGGIATLCVFTKEAVNWELGRNAGTFGVPASKNGTANKTLGSVLLGESTEAGLSYAYGTWVLKVVS